METTGYQPTPVVYTVRPGNTLYAIAPGSGRPDPLPSHVGQSFQARMIERGLHPGSASLQNLSCADLPRSGAGAPHRRDTLAALLCGASGRYRALDSREIRARAGEHPLSEPSGESQHHIPRSDTQADGLSAKAPDSVPGLCHACGDRDGARTGAVYLTQRHHARRSDRLCFCGSVQALCSLKGGRVSPTALYTALSDFLFLLDLFDAADPAQKKRQELRMIQHDYFHGTTPLPSDR